MSSQKSYSIESTITFNFDNSDLRDFSFKAYHPELEIFKTDRSNIIMSKKDSRNLEFKIKSRDITAFRASINDIISFGKVFEGVSSLCEKYTSK
ncbi:MAG: hypothetical protein EU541_03270 [Promethearchaeota archaeon]|nr:MAG: hypothetical protein EU541_03270 [Candidatus Lokiarchaeota archaeon]